MRQTDLPGLSVAIVTYAPSLQELAATVDSVTSAVQRAKLSSQVGTASLTLVDNGPGSGYRELLQALIDSKGTVAAFDRRMVISGHGNVGFGRGHNLALAAGAEELHLILNPDVLLDPEAITKGCEYLATHREVVLLSPAAVWPDGTQQFLCKRYPTILDLALRGFAPSFVRNIFRRRLARYEMQDVCGGEPVDGVPIVSGCFMLARREALVRSGGFSDDFFMYFEDFDLSIRIREQGLLAYVPSVKITHAGGQAARKGWRHIKMFAASARAFFRRHGWKLY